MADAYTSILSFANAVTAAKSFLPGDIRANIYGLPLDAPTGVISTDGSNHVTNYFRVGRYNKTTALFETYHETVAGVKADVWSPLLPETRAYACDFSRSDVGLKKTMVTADLGVLYSTEGGSCMFQGNYLVCVKRHSCIC